MRNRDSNLSDRSGCFTLPMRIGHLPETEVMTDDRLQCGGAGECREKLEVFATRSYVKL
jgi:hypothetical protein